jgi:hypothetical protein
MWGAEFNWRRGLSQGVGQARGFYAVMAISVALAVAVALADVSVLAMLVAASIVGGIGTPIGIAVLVGLARNRAVMGQQVVSPRSAIAGRVTATVIAGIGLLFIIGAVGGSVLTLAGPSSEQTGRDRFTDSNRDGPADSFAPPLDRATQAVAQLQANEHHGERWRTRRPPSSPDRDLLSAHGEPDRQVIDAQCRVRDNQGRSVGRHRQRGARLGCRGIDDGVGPTRNQQGGAP